MRVGGVERLLELVDLVADERIGDKYLSRFRPALEADEGRGEEDDHPEDDLVVSPVSASHGRILSLQAEVKAIVVVRAEPEALDVLHERPVLDRATVGALAVVIAHSPVPRRRSSACSFAQCSLQ